ncbi:hypothetical protein DID96_08240 [Burkholderia sp. Bp8963]|nr:hypothetical protein DID96_08240 [Burkholderia sp. Bp8963]
MRHGMPSPWVAGRTAYAGSGAGEKCRNAKADCGGANGDCVTAGTTHCRNVSVRSRVNVGHPVELRAGWMTGNVCKDLHGLADEHAYRQSVSGRQLAGRTDSCGPCLRT